MPEFSSWSPVALHFLGRSPGALEPWSPKPHWDPGTYMHCTYIHYFVCAAVLYHLTCLRYYTVLTIQTVCAILTYYDYTYIHYLVHGNKLCVT